MLFVVFFLLVSLIITVGLGEYLYQVFCKDTDAQEGNWKTYARDFLLFNFCCGLLAFIILLNQGCLPLNPLKLANLEPLLAFNTVCSFLTNTNWQSYSGEVALSNLSQMLAITCLQTVGAVSGLAVCIAFLRGLCNKPLGSFYQDFTRGLVYVFLPVMIIGGMFFVSQGVPQTLQPQVIVQTVEGSEQKIALGPVASLLAIKQFGTNGGGFFNANSAHPFENPNSLTNFVEIMMELALPMALVYLFGLMLGDRKQGWLIWGAMMGLFLMFWGGAYYFESLGQGNWEGKELRFGILASSLFTVATTATSSGAVSSMHDSMTPLGGLIPMADMMLNVVWGGVGVGLMGFLLYGVLAVFLTGLMVGRTPEIFGKKIEKTEIILASVAILLHPFIILVPTAISVVNDFGLSSLNNTGPHGLSEILYAYTSAAANNGSAFAGLNANTPWYNVSLATVIMLGRYVSILILLAIAGSLLKKPKLESGLGTLPTNTVLFTGVWLAVILIVGALTFIPVLVLGPVAEQMAALHGQKF